MRRWIAGFLLVLMATFLVTYGADRCHEGLNPHDPQGQHLLCIDDCAPALVPRAPAPPPPDPMPRPAYAKTVVRPVLSHEPEPEKEPPRP